MKDRDPLAAADVYYDGACPICRAEIATMRRLAEPGVGFVDVAAAHGAEARGGLDRDRLLARFHVRRADGRLVDGAAAFLALWRATPRLAPLARMLDRPWLVRIGDALYAVFLRLRPLWRRRAIDATLSKKD